MTKHIVFTGGGTGGHVYPALALVEILEKKGYRVSWIGSRSGIEHSIVSGKGIEFYSIPSGKLRRYFSIRNFIDIFKIGFALVKSILILMKIKPDFIFSKGGYVTVPPVIAAKLLKIKSMTHESDFDPGLATRINSKFVDNVLVPYEETKEYFSNAIKDKVLITGNPVRKDFYNSNRELGREIMGFNNSKPTLLVLGGSLGAKEINDLLLETRETLKDEINIYHQMGSKNYKKIEEESYRSVPYINNNMADIIAASDLIISRSGAGAIWEIATIGIPSILVPLLTGSRGDQIKNANYFKNMGAAVILDNDSRNSETLADMVINLINSRERLSNLKLNSQSIGAKNSAEKICFLIEEKL